MSDYGDYRDVEALRAQVARYNEMAGKDADELASLRAELAAEKVNSERKQAHIDGCRQLIGTTSKLDVGIEEMIQRHCAERTAMKERAEKAEQERDALAAALDEARSVIGECLRDTIGTPTEMFFGSVLKRLADPAALLAARDARKKSEGAAEALESRARTALMFAAIAKDQAVIDYLNAAAGADQQLAAAKRQEAKG